MIQSLIDYMTKVTTLGTVTIIVFSFIIIGLNGFVKKVFRFFNLVSYPWQIGQPKRGTIFVNEVFQGKIVKSQVVISEIKTILWKKIGLVD